MMRSPGRASAMLRRMVLAILLPAAGCLPRPRPYDGPAPDGVLPDAYVGCYEAEFRASEDRTETRWHFRLYPDAASSKRPGGRNGLPARRATASIQELNDPWWLITPRGIQMHIGNTLHGSYYEFPRPRGTGVLAGRAFHYSDTASRFYVEPVTARKVECPD